MKKTAIFILSCFICSMSYAADTLHVLFIGNSYTAVNNLPDVVQQMATLGGKPLNVASNTPGGTTLQQHSTNQQTLNLIRQGIWDYVVLQEQSQIPSFPDAQVDTIFYPYAKRMDSLIHASNPCAKTVFYMTWGRKNGDQINCPNFPPLCTYNGMDSLLRLRYTNIADTVSGLISPVGPLWHYLRDHNSTLELYAPDESHPSQAGTFAAACSFYTLFFGENPQNNPFHYNLSASDATTIKSAAKQVVFDSLDYWQRFSPLQPAVEAEYNFVVSGDTVTFSNLSQNAISWLWDFGDGHSDTARNPVHIFTPGTYSVCLTARQTCDSSTFCDTFNFEETGLTTVVLKPSFKVYPNPVSGDELYIQPTPSQRQSYQIFNLLGQLKQSGRLNGGENEIKLKTTLSGGIYLLRLSDENGSTGLFKFQKR